MVTANARQRKTELQRIRRSTPEGRAVTRKASDAWKMRNPEKALDATRKAMARRRTEPEYWVIHLKHRANKQGRPFDLSVEFVEKLLAPMQCSVTGLKLSWTWDGPTRQSPWSPSIDQIDPGRGYTENNIRVVCWAYNAARQAWGDEVVLEMAKALVEKQNGK